MLRERDGGQSYLQMFLRETKEMRTLVELSGYFAIDEGLGFHACKWKRHVRFGLIGDEHRSIKILRWASH